MRRIVVGADHAGLPLKRELLAWLEDEGWAVEDLGTHDTDPVDYPDYAHRVAAAVGDGTFPFGLLVCGSGVGMSVAANRHPEVRAALVTEPYSATMARRHNDANVLCMGARVVAPGLGREILRAFLEAEYEGGRHAPRVQKIELAG